MQLSDFFIGKPGPGSISEAIQQRLPVIVVRKRLDHAAGALQRGLGARTQRRNRAGLLQGHRSGVTAITGRLDDYRANVARIQNRAIFEIPAILDGIFASQRCRFG